MQDIDIYQKLVADFGDNLPAANSILSKCGSNDLYNPRVHRALVYLAAGDLSRLEELSKTSAEYVLREAEYQGGNERVFDFSKTFYELGILISKRKNQRLNEGKTS